MVLLATKERVSKSGRTRMSYFCTSHQALYGPMLPRKVSAALGGSFSKLACALGSRNGALQARLKSMSRSMGGKIA